MYWDNIMNFYESYIYVIREVSIFCKVLFLMCKNDEVCYVYVMFVFINIVFCKGSYFFKEYRLIY